MDGTKFVYNGVTYEIDSCPEYPFIQTYQPNTIASQMQDGYTTTRPRISRNLSIFTLTYRVVPKTEKLVIQSLETIVRCTDIFEWYPFVDLDNTDPDTAGNSGSNPNFGKSRIRSVRLVAPIQYNLVNGNYYDFTITLQEAQ